MELMEERGPLLLLLTFTGEGCTCCISRDCLGWWWWWLHCWRCWRLDCWRCRRLDCSWVDFLLSLPHPAPSFLSVVVRNLSTIGVPYGGLSWRGNHYAEAGSSLEVSIIIVLVNGSVQLAPGTNPARVHSDLGIWPGRDMIFKLLNTKDKSSWLMDVHTLLFSDAVERCSIQECFTLKCWLTLF